MSPRRIVWMAAVVVVVLAVLAGVGIWWFSKDDAPAPVNLETAASTLTDDTPDSPTPADETAPMPPTATPTAADETAPASPTAPDETAPASPTAESTAPNADESTPAPVQGAAPGEVSGLWLVDTSVGEFSFEDSTGTFVGFRVDEELAGIGSTTAVGRTPAISGRITIDGQTVTSGAIEADMTAITTDDSRRDRAVQRALDTANFPTATFTMTEPINLGIDPAFGQPISATATGELMIHGITRSVDVAIQAQLVDDTILVVGSTPVVFADYDVEVPSVPIVLSAEDHGTIELQLLLTRSP